jgi:hypothetical protein
MAYDLVEKYSTYSRPFSNHFLCSLNTRLENFFHSKLSLKRSKTKKTQNILAAGINGGYYSGGLTQQAHSTTPLEAPHSAGSHAPSGPPSAVSAPVSAVAAPPPGSIQHAMVSKSVCL